MDLKQKRTFHYGDSNDHIENAADSAIKQCYVEPSSRTYVASATYLTTSGSTPIARQQNRPRGYNSDGDLSESFPEVELSNKQYTSRPNSLENSENASTSSSPLNLKGSCDRNRGRSESFSSEDMMLSKDMPGSSRESPFCPISVGGSNTKHSTPLTRNDLFSYDIPQKNNRAQAQCIRHRSASPGSEMVTLEEFLEESNRLSPLNDASSRDDLLSDYFRKANEPPCIGNQLSRATRKETAKMPTSYVTPTVKMPGSNEDGRPTKPGHCVKPNLRPTESELLANSYKLTHSSPNQPSRGSRQMASPPHCNTTNRQSSSLNRAFSLASADLLRATGPETYRRYDSLPKQMPADINMGKDLDSQTPRLPVAATSQVSLRERPQSAKVVGSIQGVDSRCRQLDVRRLSLAPPKDERSLLFPPSYSPTPPNDLEEQAKVDLEQHGSSPQYATTKIKSKQIARSGEVATVSPVRVVSSNTDGSNAQLLGQADPSITKCQSRSPENKTLAGGTEEANRGASAKNPPSSSDPNGDQQTVWYEYGCV